MIYFIELSSVHFFQKKNFPKGIFGCKYDTHFSVIKMCIYLDTSLAGVIEGKLIFSVKVFRNILSVFSCVSVTEVQVKAKLSDLFHLFSFHGKTHIKCI